MENQDILDNNFSIKGGIGNFDHRSNSQNFTIFCNQLNPGKYIIRLIPTVSVGLEQEYVNNENEAAEFYLEGGVSDVYRQKGFINELATYTPMTINEICSAASKYCQAILQDVDRRRLSKADSYTDTEGEFIRAMYTEGKKVAQQYLDS